MTSVPSALIAATSADAWRWQSHVEVWVLVLGVLVMALYAVRVVGPKVVPHGRPVVTARPVSYTHLTLPTTPYV